MSCAIESESHRRRATAHGRSRPRLPRGHTRDEAWSSRRLATLPAFALRRDITRDDAVDALVAGLLGDKRQAELLAHYCGKEASNRVFLPTCRLHDGGDRCAFW